eukprot:COSAG02_NODE_2946_length_7685_cov_17.516478_2_plen_214_part_00
MFHKESLCSSAYSFVRTFDMQSWVTKSYSSFFPCSLSPLPAFSTLWLVQHFAERAPVRARARTVLVCLFGCAGETRVLIGVRWFDVGGRPCNQRKRWGMHVLQHDRPHRNRAPTPNRRSVHHCGSAWRDTEKYRLWFSARARALARASHARTHAHTHARTHAHTQRRQSRRPRLCSLVGLHRALLLRALQSPMVYPDQHGTTRGPEYSCPRRR